MSYALARAQIVSMLESITGLSRGAQLGHSFRQVPEGHEEDRQVHDRGFYVRAVRHAADAQTVGTAGRWRTAEIDVVVEYGRHVAGDVLDLAIADDYRLITDKLLDVESWGRPASTIVLLSAPPSEELFPADVDDDDDATTLAVRVALTYSL